MKKATATRQSSSRLAILMIAGWTVLVEEQPLSVALHLLLYGIVPECQAVTKPFLAFFPLGFWFLRFFGPLLFLTPGQLFFDRRHELNVKIVDHLVCLICALLVQFRIWIPIDLFLYPFLSEPFVMFCNCHYYRSRFGRSSHGIRYLGCTRKVVWLTTYNLSREQAILIAEFVKRIID